MADNTDLIIKLRAETAQLRKDLSNAKRQMGTFNKNINSIGANIRNTMLAAFGGAAVLSGIRQAIGSLTDFEFTMDKVAAVSGASADQIKKLNENALELGRNTKFTATEVANLQLELSKLGFRPDQIIASTDAIRKLATVTDEELGESAKTMAGTLNSFNLTASESERVANVMAESFSKSALTLEKFTVATSNSGAIANALGVTLEQNTARIGALVDANIDASKAGTDLRKIYVDLNDKGISYNSALDMVANSSDKVATATELVGIRAAGALVILSQQREKVDELTKSLGDNNKELDGMVSIMEDNLLTDWQKFTSAIDGAIQRSNVLIPVLRSVVQTLTGMVNGLTQVSDIQKDLERAGIEESNFFGLSTESQNKLFKFYADLKKEVKAAIEDIKEGTRTFDGQSIASLKAADAIATVNKRLDAYKSNKFYEDIKKEAIPILDELNKRLEEEAQKIQKVINLQEKQSSLIGVSGLQSLGFTAQGAGAELPFESSTGLLQAQEMMAGIKEAIRKSREEIQTEYAELISTISTMANDLNSILETTIESLIVGIASSLTSGDGLESAFAGMLDILGSGLMQLGKALIAYGITIKAIQESLTKGLLANPVAAVGAGVAAIAAGALLKNRASSILSNTASGGTGGGGGTGGVGRFSQESTGKTIEVVGKISGRDLALVLANENQNKSRNGG